MGSLQAQCQRLTSMSYSERLWGTEWLWLEKGSGGREQFCEKRMGRLEEAQGKESRLRQGGGDRVPRSSQDH